MANTFEFDLLPESGELPRDEFAWGRIKTWLLEFQPARRVQRLEHPVRIHVEAFGTRGDEVASGILQRVEKLCGTRLHQAVTDGVTPEQFVRDILAAVPEIRYLVDQHLHDHGELLIHVLLPDLLRRAVRWFQSGERDRLNRLLGAVELGLRLADYAVVNAICVSFVEHVGAFPDETDKFIRSWPPRLYAEYLHMK